MLPVPKFVEVHGLTGREQSQVEESFTHSVKKPIDQTTLEESIGNLQGTGYFSTINYTITEHNGEPGLLIRPLEKQYGPPFVNLGVNILGNDSNTVLFGMGTRVTFFNLAGSGSELRVGGMIGQIAGLDGELYKPFTATSHFFVAPHAFLSHAVDAYYQGSTQLEQYKDKKNGVGADIGYIFNRRTELRVGEDYQWLDAHRTIGTPAQQEFSITPLVTNVKFQYLGQDDIIVPTHGNVARAVFSHYTQRPFESGGVSQLHGVLEQFFPIRSRGVLFATLQGGTSFGADNLGLAGFNLGGPLRLSAYAQNELLGTDFVVGQGGYLYRLIRLNPVFADAIYVGGLYEIGTMYGGNPQTPSLPNDVAGLVIVKTFIGPIFGGLSIGDSDHRKWYFGVGRIF
jgi:NTE family protein